jgi:hypothetical protein
MKHVYCPTNPHEKAMQRALIQYRDPKNRKLVVEALHKAGREDLIGYGPKCLVRPEREGQQTRKPGKGGGGSKPRSTGRPRGTGRSGGTGKTGGRKQGRNQSRP